MVGRLSGAHDDLDSEDKTSLKTPAKLATPYRETIEAAESSKSSSMSCVTRSDETRLGESSSLVNESIVFVGGTVSMLTEGGMVS